MLGALQEQKVNGREEKIRRGLAIRGVGGQLEQLPIFRDGGSEPAVEGRSPTLDFRETPKLAGQEIERRPFQGQWVYVGALLENQRVSRRSRRSGTYFTSASACSEPGRSRWT